MQARTAAFDNLDAQTLLRMLVLGWKQSLELPNSVVRNTNHVSAKYGYDVTKSKVAMILTKLDRLV
jgi:hypothetical protein